MLSSYAGRLRLFQPIYETATKTLVLHCSQQLRELIGCFSTPRLSPLGFRFSFPHFPCLAPRHLSCSLCFSFRLAWGHGLSRFNLGANGTENVLFIFMTFSLSLNSLGYPTMVRSDGLCYGSGVSASLLDRHRESRPGSGRFSSPPASYC